jgi:MFS family permease
LRKGKNRKSVSHKLRKYLGLEKNVLVMTLTRHLRDCGSGLWGGYFPKVLETLGASGPMIGVFGIINSFVSIVFSYIGGAISDRMGRARALVFFTMLSLLGYIFYLVAPTWWLFIPGSILLTASAQFSFMGSLALTGDSVIENRRAVSMATQKLLGLPVALLAPPLGGALILQIGLIKGFRVGLGITVILTIAAILLQKKHFNIQTPAVKHINLDFISIWKLIRPELRYLLVSNCLMTFGSGMSSMFLVLYIMNVIGLSAVQYGLLQSIMIAAGALFSIPVTKFADKQGLVGRKPYVLVSFALIAAFPFMVITTSSWAGLIMVFVLRGIRESFDPVRKAMIVDLSGDIERGRVLGFFFFVISLVCAPSSLIAGLLWQWNEIAPFIMGGGISLLGFLLFLVKVKVSKVSQSTHSL